MTAWEHELEKPSEGDFAGGHTRHKTERGLHHFLVQVKFLAFLNQAKSAKIFSLDGQREALTESKDR